MPTKERPALETEFLSFKYFEQYVEIASYLIPRTVTERNMNFGDNSICTSRNGIACLNLKPSFMKY